MNNIFLFDIDGTISQDGIILKSTIDSLNKLRENGDLVMLSTGRCLGQMEEVLSKIKIDGAILNNGALAIINDEIIYSSPIDKALINEMLADGLHVACLSKDDYYRIEEDSVFDDFSKYFNIASPNLYKSLKEDDVYSLGVFSYDINSINISKYPSLRFLSPCYLGYDVMNVGITKAAPINAIKNRYKNMKLIAFGDNLNDIEIIKAVDLGIAMGNANPKLKEVSDYITTNVDDDGIYNALKYFNYI